MDRTNKINKKMMLGPLFEIFERRSRRYEPHFAVEHRARVPMPCRVHVLSTIPPPSPSPPPEGDLNLNGRDGSGRVGRNDTERLFFRPTGRRGCTGEKRETPARSRWGGIAEKRREGREAERVCEGKSGGGGGSHGGRRGGKTACL